MSRTRSNLPIRKIEPFDRPRLLGMLPPRERALSAGKDWTPWAGMIPVALFHVPSPGLAGRLEVREPPGSYGIGSESDIEAGIARRHLRPVYSLRSANEVRNSWEKRVDGFMDDHREAGLEILERVGMSRTAELLLPEKVGALSESYSEEFTFRFGEDLLDTFLFGLEIACRYGSSLSPWAMMDGGPDPAPCGASWKKLERAVASFDLGAWAVLSSMEIPLENGLRVDTAIELVLIAKRSAAHAYGVFQRARKEARR